MSKANLLNYMLYHIIYKINKLSGQLHKHYLYLNTVKYAAATSGGSYYIFSISPWVWTTISGAYVDGVSLTHGSPRHHIWTFAAGASENNPTWTTVCPCDANVSVSVPPFVGEDYFCESGLHEPWNHAYHTIFHPDNPLWDGQNCLSNSTCCSLHGPRYFTKQLPATNDDIEARICLHDSAANDNIAVQLVELYVQ